MEKEKQKAVEKLLSQFSKEDVFLAPMADVNDFAFRRLCREKGGIKLCWTGFIVSHQWVIADNEAKRRDVFYTDGCEKNLVGQLLGNNADELIQTAKDIEKYCDMIDLNLGCTHCVASKTECGFYMTNNAIKRAETIKIVQKLSENLTKPLSAKIRVIPDGGGKPSIEETVKFAQELENAGVNLLTVHGRTMRSDKHGDVDYELISRVVKGVSIPVIANGGVNSKEDALDLIEKTGARFAMAAQCFVSNPMHLVSPDLSPSEIAKEYIRYAKESDESIHHAKKHMYGFFSNKLREQPEKAVSIRDAWTFDDLLKLCESFN